MKLLIFSMFDSAAKAFTQPFFVQTEGSAIRIFQNQINQKDSITCKYPDQFTLFRIGEFEDNDASIVSCDPVSLGNGVIFKEAINISQVDASSILEEIRKLDKKITQFSIHG